MPHARASRRAAQLTPQSTALTAGTLTLGSTGTFTQALTLATDSGGTAPYSNQLQQAPDVAGSPGSWANIQSPQTGATGSWSVTGLSASTKYWWRVVVTDNVAATANSNQVTATTSAGAATAYTFTGPGSGVVNAASTVFTLTPNGTYTGTITPASTGLGTFSPTSLTWAADASAKTFTYTPTTTAGSPHTISTTSSPALTDPATIAYLVNFATVRYVSSTTGNDSNDGLTSGTPKLTLQAAVNLLSGDGTIRVVAPLATPLRESATHSGAFTISIDGGGSPWYIFASELHGSGWASLGGGVYSKTIGWDPSVVNIVVDTVQVDGNGNNYRLVRLGSTPTTPGVNQFGTVGTTMYVHLFGGVDPNTNAVEVARYTNAIFMHGSGDLVLTQMVGRYANASIVLQDAGGVDCNTCTSEYAFGNGFATQGQAVGSKIFKCTNCMARCNSDDGYNVHGNPGQAVRMDITNCIADWILDNGASNHDDTIMNLIGGELRHCGNSGVYSINNATFTLNGTRVHHNAAGTGIAAVSWHDPTMKGSLINCEVDNNTCPGVHAAPGAAVTIIGLNSHNNVGNDTYHRPGDRRDTLHGGIRELAGGVSV